MIERIVLIGAGSAAFTRGLLSDIVRLGVEAEVRLVDVSADALQVAEGLARKLVAAASAPVRVCASTDRREVLRGATAVISTVGVGGRRAWERDVSVPRRYGIYQPVGDTVMPGGMSRALRMVPAMVAVAEDVLDLAPDALFFNYGNPMSAVCRAIRKATGANVVGLCHGVHHVAASLAALLGVERSDLAYSAVGINHCTWFTEVRVAGRDRLPELLRHAATVALDRADPLSHADPFCWRLAHLFGAFPAVGDRHVSEFFPGLLPGGIYYGKRLGFDVFSMEETIAYGDRVFDQMREVALGPEPLPEEYLGGASGEHEQVIDIIDSIRRDTGTVYSVNLPNDGQAPGLPRDAVVESPAVATAAGLRPITQPRLRVGLSGTLATRFASIETVVEAALEGSRAKFAQALVLDGACPSIEVAQDLSAALIDAQADHLPQFTHSCQEKAQ